MKLKKFLLASTLCAIGLGSTFTVSAKYEKKLIEAAKNGDLQAVKKYISNGADINAVDTEGGNALAYAILEGHVEIVRFLMKHGAYVADDIINNARCLIACAGLGITDVMMMLLEHGADVNAADGGFTALMCVAGLGHTEIAKILIEHGADVNAKDDYGETALMFAAFNGKTEMARMLIEHGADIYATKYGKTASKIAAEKGYRETANLIKSYEKGCVIA